MNLAHRTLLCLSASHFEAYAWDGKKLSAAYTFGADSDGHEKFSAYLRQHPCPAYLLADVIEEDFRQEAVPHLIGRNRHELIERKLEQYYRATPFRMATTQYRHAEGRRDDEMLFCALTNPQHISPWLDILRYNHIPLVGIYSLPNISATLLNGIKSDHVLLLSWEKYAGLRQSYFHKKQLRLSRLTSLNDPSSFCASAAIETSRMLHYLTSLNLPPENTHLEVYIICHKQDRPELDNALRGQSDLHYSYMDIQALSDDHNAGIACQDSDATQLFLHLLTRKKPVNQYAKAIHTHYYLLWKLRWILFGFAAIITLASMLLGAISLWQGRNHETQAESLLIQAAQFSRQTEELKQKFPANTTSPARMKTAVTLAREFENRYPTPEQILLGLSSVLDQFTRIHSRKIDWQASSTDANIFPNPAQVISLEGELLEFGNDYRSALSYLGNFQQALNQQGYTVTAQKTPLDISPSGSLSGDGHDNPDKSAQFALTLIWRHPQ